MPQGRQLVTIELRFVAEEPTGGLVDRVREAVSMIVGREALEEFRAKSMPTDPKKPTGA